MFVGVPISKRFAFKKLLNGWTSVAYIGLSYFLCLIFLAYWCPLRHHLALASASHRAHKARCQLDGTLQPHPVCAVPGSTAAD